MDSGFIQNLLNKFQGEEDVNETPTTPNRSPASFDVNNFLNIQSGIESSYGKNTDHPKLESGMHKGMSAIGEFGLMPNTVDDIIKNIIKRPDHPSLKTLLESPPERKMAILNKNPQMQQYLARQLAKHLKNKGHDEETASVAWQYGHNLTPEQIRERQDKYQDRLEKYKKFKGLRYASEE